MKKQQLRIECIGAFWVLIPHTQIVLIHIRTKIK